MVSFVRKGSKSLFRDISNWGFLDNFEGGFDRSLGVLILVLSTTHFSGEMSLIFASRWSVNEVEIDEAVTAATNPLFRSRRRRGLSATSTVDLERVHRPCSRSGQPWHQHSQRPVFHRMTTPPQAAVLLLRHLLRLLVTKGVSHCSTWLFLLPLCAPLPAH